jgi:hypothetical protein
MKKDEHDYRIIDESFGFPSALMNVLNFFGYVTMALPFGIIVGTLFLGMWGVNVLIDCLASTLSIGAAAVFPFVGQGLKLILVLIAARSMFLTVTLYPPYLPVLIEYAREQLRKDLGL